MKKESPPRVLSPSGKYQFDIVLREVGKSRLGVVKTLKELLNIGLKEAKDMADAAPIYVGRDLTKEEVENIN